MVAFDRSAPIRQVRAGCLAITLSCCVWATSAANPVAADELDSEVVLTTAERLLDIIEGHGAAVPATSYSVAALAEQLETVEAAFGFVRDQTALVPYSGLLKGAAGVLLDRDGNSLDRSLLLARLVSAQGHEVRLARARLSDADALGLRDLSGAARFDASDAVTPDEIGDPATVAADLLPPERIEAVLASGERQADLAYERSDVATGALVEQLRDLAAATAAERVAFEEQAHLAALGDHWWVQVRADDAWRDLDPTLEAPGSARSAVFEVVALEAVPEGDTHRVTIDVILEITDAAGAATRETVLSATRSAAELHGHSIRLTIEPLDAPRPEELSELADDVDAALARLAATRDWAPHLAVGGVDLYDQLFSLQGAVVPVSLEAVQAAQLGRGIERAVEDTVGTATGLLEELGTGAGTGAGAGGVSERTGQREATAVWLRLTLERPGGESATHWRTLYDHYRRPPSLEPASPDQTPAFDAVERERRMYALLRETRLFVEAARVSQAQVQRTIGRRVTTARPALLAAFGGPVLDAEVMARATDAANRLDSDLLSLALGRWLLNPGADLVYLDRPSLFLAARWDRVERDSEGERVVTRVHTLDILENHVGVRSRPGLDAFEVRVAQGVADTAAEAAAVDDGSLVVNAARRYVEDQDEGTSWHLVRTPDHRVIAEAPSVLRPLLAAELDRGAILVSPPLDASRGVWWRVDPVAGSTLGIGVDGSGSASAETSTLLLRVASWSTCVGLLAIRLVRGQGFNLGVGVICFIGGFLGTVGAATTTAWLGNLGGAIGLFATILGEFAPRNF